MVLSVHLDGSPRPATVDGAAPGLLWHERMATIPLAAGPTRPPVPTGSAVLAAWEDAGALEASAPRTAWNARLEPLRAVGSWSDLPGLGRPERPVEQDEPVAVLTLGRLKLRRTVPFLRTSAPAERLAIGDPDLLLGTALAWPPRLVATFTVWRTAAAMRAYATGAADGREHVDAMRAHAAEPFHDESIFARFRPLSMEGRWRGATRP